MAGEAEATKLIRDHRVRIGFEPSASVTKAAGAKRYRVTPARVAAAVARLLDAQDARTGRRPRAPRRTARGCPWRRWALDRPIVRGVA